MHVTELLNKVDWTEILQSQQPDLSWAPSTIYRPEDLVIAVQKMIQTGVGGYKLLGDDHGTKYALVNIAAFLAQSMQETIQYDACDENNWDSSSGYTASNACGQLGQSYQDYQCSGADAHMQCEVDPEMQILATTHAKWYGAPAPMFCAPKSKVPKAPKWNLGGWCDPADWQSWESWPSVDDFVMYLENGGTCKDYQHQKAGYWEQCGGEGCANHAAPNFNRPARTDVEGCCWWGRGVIQTTGVCNFGKLNYYVGARAAREGRPALFPDVDFCRTPDAICTSTEHPDLKWIAGLFYWTKEVQGYPNENSHGFDYVEELKQFTDAGNIDDSTFIHKCSGIVNRGCPALSCPAGQVHDPQKRAANFRTVLTAFGYPWQQSVGPGPTGAPTNSNPAPDPDSPPGPPPTSCSSQCASCVSIPGNPHSATDQHCAPCANGQPWWPCNVQGLCTCRQDVEVEPFM